ncbi:MAG TPA: ABC transporter substrate-binding protein [Acetobacteraceae bacterium]|nr:ABC transporter substrate-binding protein [Acetobacteraceae bacterium]
MLRRAFLAVLVLCLSGAARAADIVDATGRHVQVPDHIARVLPAGPPAAVLLAALAPDLMLGWPMPVSPEARADLSPAAAALPEVPRLTGRADVSAAVAALHPDLIVDYGTVSPRYADLARATQQRTGIPTILLDGSLAQIPQAFRTLGGILHRQARAAVLADFTAALLALPLPAGDHPRVLCARGPDGLTVVAPGTDVAGVFTRLGWQVVAPAGRGPFRTATLEDIRALNPDVLVFSDPAMRVTLAQSAPWQSLRAVHAGHVLVAPALPFGWIEEPPSINRLLGVAWLSGRDPMTLAATFNAVVYGRVLTAAQLRAALAGVRTVPP